MRAPIEIKTKDGESHHAKVPTLWSDITLKEFYDWTRWSMKSKGSRDPLEFYSIITGLDIEILAKVREASTQVTLDAFTRFLWKNVEDAKLHLYPVPETIRIQVGIHHKTITIPKKIELKQLGQKMAIGLHFSELKKTVKDPVEFQLQRSAGIIAIFLYQEITGRSMDEDFDLDVALLYVHRLSDLPAVEMVPLAVFFWNHFIE
tara:strand:- start:13225 stop:13836 length:612 start_codon:yes stop_codon:yes gene_type:complete